ncbi:CHAP domain-containing protein [Roseivirga sp. BDSF3-8]|uniref:CHAP domain-containing protein n=1 Tax=Roseivirga sp. BDSF3-8 TaxID=3241598 RepID=UPI0035321ABA
MKQPKFFSSMVATIMMFTIASCGDATIEEPQPVGQITQEESALHSSCTGSCWDCYQYVKCRLDNNLPGYWGSIAQKRANINTYTPSVGAVVILFGSGYNTTYGHMALVTSVTSTHIYVDEGNWNGTCSQGRSISRTDSRIQGYYKR